MAFAFRSLRQSVIAKTFAPQEPSDSEIPQLGVFVAPNLTSDAETGLGDWTKEEIVAALQTGKRPDGRELAPIMPWQDLANLTREDAMAIASYLKSLPPIKHKVPGPFAAGVRPTVPVMKIIAP